nr:hypothetical protein [Planctomycetota bacterium]
MAQEDYYKAAAQRSRWIKDNLVDLDELPGFEKRLKDGWEPLFEIMIEGLADGCGEAELAKCGVDLYNWSQATAPHLSGLWVRPQFQAGYMTKGSFHMLADDPPRLGWHPHYAQRLASLDPATGRTCP